jgi:hypothetical protein
MVEEHGCPYDFHRWTSRGLENLAGKHGFEIMDSVKFTTEIRGIVQLSHQFVGHLRAPGFPVLRYPLAAVRRFYNWIFLPLMNWGADRFSRQAIVPASDPSSLYVGVCILGQKRSA